MEKVKLPQKIAEYLNVMTDRHKSIHAVYDEIKHGYGVANKIILRDYFFESKESSPDILLKALVNDYEVEETPEEKLIKVYKQYLQSTSIGSMDARLFACKAAGIRETLDILGIEIKGINEPKEEY
ncbi:hypothetical protein [Oceanobacillus oncorhynchi]|uniref:hypothetical protein n=1 Tax=Oceanobacillus oncorhynchi TaxID=545501 RepID=UPI0034D78DC1